MDQHDESAPSNDRRGTGHDGHVIGLDRRRPLMRFDMTFNVPTILSLVATGIGLATSAVALYNNLDRRQLASEFELGKLNQRVEKNEGAVNNLREEQSKREATLRAEMKGDVAEVKDILYRIYYGQGPGRTVPQPTQQQLNEWRK